MPDKPCEVILKRLREGGQTQGWLAQRLGVDRHYASRLANGRVGISARMAVKLSEALGETPEFWGRLQRDYDVSQVPQQPHRDDVVTS